MFRPMLVIVLIFAWSLSLAEDNRLGSSAEIWNQRTDTEKTAYLEGLCEGFGASNIHKLGDLLCDKEKITKQTRFCFAVHLRNGADAISYLNKFYSNRNQTDIPIWAAIGAYNDKSCNEERYSHQLRQLQRQLECERQLFNLRMTKGISDAAINSQAEHCEKISRVQ